MISAQLGRPARGDNAVVHRCVYGLPTVVRVGPRLEDGTPFPTTFWLSCPLAIRHAGRLEAEGEMRSINATLERDPAVAAAYRGAHERYLAFREQLGPPLPEGVGSAGGMPTHVKCLHVHLAHHLATGDNPVGAHALERIRPMPCPGPCVEQDLLRAAYGSGPPPEASEEAWRLAAPPDQRPLADRDTEP